VADCNENTDYCGITPSCIMFNTKNTCNLNINIKDGPCAFVTSSVPSGTCYVRSSVSCNMITYGNDCVEYGNSQFMNCFFDITDGSGKCKTVGGGCANNYHYEIKDSNCTLKSCSSRTANSSSQYPCGPDSCYKDLGYGNKCVTSCTNQNHYSLNTSTHSCELKSCTN
jgi:hypothetical protein